MAYHHQNNHGGPYSQRDATKIHQQRTYNALQRILNPQGESYMNLQGTARPGMSNPTQQPGHSPEEVYSNILHRAQRNDREAIALIHERRMEPLMGAFAAGRDVFPRPYPSRFRQPHYAPQNPMKS